MTATEAMAEQLARLHAYPQSLVGDANERFKELFESPRRFFAWKPANTEDAGRVWLRRVWERSGRFYRNRPAEKPATLTSRPIRVPFRVDDTFRLENWRPVTLASAKQDDSSEVKQ